MEHQKRNTFIAVLFKVTSTSSLDLSWGVSDNTYGHTLVDLNHVGTSKLECFEFFLKLWFGTNVISYARSTQFAPEHPIPCLNTYVNLFILHEAIWGLDFFSAIDDTFPYTYHTVRNNWVSTRPCLCNKTSIFEMP